MDNSLGFQQIERLVMIFPNVGPVASGNTGFQCGLTKCQDGHVSIFTYYWRIQLISGTVMGMDMDFS
jgi:hypothetical protein